MLAVWIIDMFSDVYSDTGVYAYRSYTGER